MKTKSNIWMSLFMLVAGIVLIVTHSDGRLLTWIIMLLGWLFAIPGFIGLLIVALTARKHTDTPAYHTTLNTFSYAIALIAGIIFLLFPQLFAGILVYVLGAILIAAGIWEIVALAVSRIPGLMPWWLYIMPVLSVAAGVALFTTDLKTTESMFTLVAGIALTCIGANGIFMSLTGYATRRTIRHQPTIAQPEEPAADDHSLNP